MGERRVPSGLPYSPWAIEQHWQQRWDEAGLAVAELDVAERVFYNVADFPYPSAEGLPCHLDRIVDCHATK